MFVGRHRLRRYEVTSGVQRCDHLVPAVQGDETEPDAVEEAARHRDRLETGAGNGIGDLDLGAAGIAADGQHLRVSLQVLGKAQLVAVAGGAYCYALLPNLALLALIPPGTAPVGALQPPVNRGQPLP